MEARELTPRHVSPVEVFKSIRIVGHEPGRFLGHLRYLRVLHPAYKYKTGDVLDASILDSLKSMYAEAYPTSNLLLLFNEQLEDCLRITAGIESPVLTYFYQTPTLSDNTPPASSAFPLRLNFTLWVPQGDERLSFMHKEILVRVDGGNLRTLMATIKAI